MFPDVLFCDRPDSRRTSPLSPLSELGEEIAIDPDGVALCEAPLESTKFPPRAAFEEPAAMDRGEPAAFCALPTARAIRPALSMAAPVTRLSSPEDAAGDAAEPSNTLPESKRECEDDETITLPLFFEAPLLMVTSPALEADSPP
jgi:hypothetical protein